MAYWDAPSGLFSERHERRGYSFEALQPLRPVYAHTGTRSQQVLIDPMNDGSIALLHTKSFPSAIRVSIAPLLRHEITRATVGNNGLRAVSAGNGTISGYTIMCTAIHTPS
ncbi:hypothetical protein PsYK624_048250 [Phanerochaete sordida]|uniref:Uncharacterized protein n=1 Tax=Phanerochaete sordida TaxID=48140 RepID=A0A9P3G623_9APHY|nr:hypothetical protein PsYK624_048250 [Phanerochaete sordida]